MENKLQRQIWIFALIAAPLLISIAQFYWRDGRLTATSGWIQVLGFVFWIPAFQAMFTMIKDRFPGSAAWGFLIAIYACVAGAGFGYDGIYTDAFAIESQEAATNLHEEIGIPLVLTLFIPGLLFPLSLLFLGIQLIRAKQIPIWGGLILILAAVGFPLSRVPRIDLLAHLDNALLLISHIIIALALMKKVK
jgi:hypothetical protein